jgi:hypothetical protein
MEVSSFNLFQVLPSLLARFGKYERCKNIISLMHGQQLNGSRWSGAITIVEWMLRVIEDGVGAQQIHRSRRANNNSNESLQAEKW